MKLPPIPGKIYKVGKILPVKKGFTQVVIITQPEKKDNTGRVSHREQFFVVNIWSNNQSDSRFLPQSRVNTDCIAELYLEGPRWTSGRDFQYNNKLNLDKWIE